MIITQQGFNLLEIMLVITIISIVSMIATPLYFQFFSDEKRLEASHELIKLGLKMEEYHFIHHSYKGATLPKLSVPAVVAKNSYKLKIHSALDSYYLLLAQPLPPQNKRDHGCGTLSYDSMGNKGKTGSAPMEKCW